MTAWMRRGQVRLAAWVARHVPALPGRWRLLRWLRGQSEALNFLPPLAVRTREGSLLLIEAHNNRDMYVDPSMIDKDDAVNHWFSRLVTAGDTVLDVGANMGRMSLLAARLAGPAGQVHAFEPCPKVMGSLWRNLQLNGATNVTVWPFAAADASGMVEFHMPVGTNSAWASMRELGAGAAISIQVPALRIDSLPGLQDQRIKLVKIDVEGAEMRALAGLEQILAREQPYVILELTDAWLRQLGASSAELIAFMQRLGYSAWTLEGEQAVRMSTAPIEQVDALFVPEARRSSFAALTALDTVAPGKAGLNAR